jgi:predicted metalloprotease with PDZ domain
MIRYLSFVLLATFALACAGETPEQFVTPLHYEISVPDPVSGEFHIALELEAGVSPILLALPRSTPGGLNQNHARYLSDLRVTDEGGTSLPLQRQESHVWSVDPGAASRLRAEYTIHRNEDDELRLVTNWLSEDGGYFHGATLLLFPVGQTDAPATLEFRLPTGWRVISPLPETDTGVFEASSYDQAAWTPFEIGDPEERVIDVGGIPVRLCFDAQNSFNNDPELDRRITDIFRHHIGLFGGAPFEEFLVLFHWRPDLEYGGGVARRQALVMNIGKEWAADLARNMAGTFAHESFHAWNFATFYPLENRPYDYLGENGSRFHWFIEGATNYYVILSFVRVWGFGEDQALSIMANAANQLEQSPGFGSVSLADAGRASWAEPVEWVNLPEGGQAVAFALDLLIRQATDYEKSLDDFMRALYEESLEPGYAGYTREGFLSVVESVAGTDLEPFFNDHVEGTKPIDFKTLLPSMGATATRNADGLWEFSIETEVSGQPEVSRRSPFRWRRGDSP